MVTTKLRKDLKLFVIVMRGWAEIRVGKVPPKPHVTHHLKTVIESVYHDDGGFMPRYEPREVTVDLTTTTWTGGRVLGGLKTSTLRGLSGRIGTLKRDSVRTFQPDSPAGRAILAHLETHQC